MIEDEDTPTDDDGVHDLRSFGRRRGRKISGRQTALLETLLPTVSVPVPFPVDGDVAGLFGQPGRDVWLEIGFGGGEHLVWQAAANPGVGLIGSEPFEEGVVKVLTAIAEQGLGNIRLHPDDVRPLLRTLPEASLARVFILFADPWPKRKHLKRRLINATLIAMLARAMRRGAELRIATDIADYARTILMAFQTTDQFRWRAAGPDDWRLRPADWPETRYERKANREGRRSVYLTFERV